MNDFRLIKLQFSLDDIDEPQDENLQKILDTLPVGARIEFREPDGIKNIGIKGENDTVWYRERDHR